MGFGCQFGGGTVRTVQIGIGQILDTIFKPNPDKDQISEGDMKWFPQQIVNSHKKFVSAKIAFLKYYFSPFFGFLHDQHPSAGPQRHDSTATTRSQVVQAAYPARPGIK